MIKVGPIDPWGEITPFRLPDESRPRNGSSTQILVSVIFKDDKTLITYYCPDAGHRSQEAGKETLPPGHDLQDIVDHVAEKIESALPDDLQLQKPVSWAKYEWEKDRITAFAYISRAR